MPRQIAWIHWLALSLAIIAIPISGFSEPTTSIRPVEHMPVEVLRPAPNDVFEAGHPITVSWRATRDLEAEGIFEWEAFLSFDRGNSWPLRITPHLDADISSFDFVMPLIASDQIRLMLRFGDEERELGYILPHSFRSVIPAGSTGAPQPIVPTTTPGERAHAHVDGVVLWVEGNRRGGNLELLGARLDPPSLHKLQPTELMITMFLGDSRRETVSLAGISAGQRLPDLIGDTRTRILKHILAQPVLLLTCRQNE